MKKVGLLFDSSYKIGGGHFWRCFNLAKSIKKKNLQFFFISNYLKDNFIKILKNENFNYVNISNLNHTNSLTAKVNLIGLDILITDYYKLKNIQKKTLKKYVNYLAVIDDFTYKIHSSDLFINNNFLNLQSIKKIKKLNPKSRLLLGPKYSILDKSFFKIRNKKSKINNKISIFCFFGSSDPSNETMKCLNVLSGYKNLNVNVLIGKLNKNYIKVKQKFKSSRNFKFFYNIPNKKIYSIMNNSHISIGSGGINMLERLFLGIPSIVICTAENQKNSIENLVKKKFIIFLGNFKKVKESNIKDAVDNLINNEAKTRKIRKKLNLYFNKIKKVYLISKIFNLIIKNIKSNNQNV